MTRPAVVAAGTVVKGGPRDHGMTLDPTTTRALSRAAKSATTGVAKRDRLIVEAVRAGGGVREVARAVGMNHTSVLHIVKRESK